MNRFEEIKNNRYSFQIQSIQAVSRFFYWILLIIFYNASLYGIHGNELKLPVPNGGEMVFVPVCVNRDSDALGWEKIKLGDPSGGFMERPRSMALGGSFPLDQNGIKVWCFYMGKNEVTREQYISILNPRKASTPIEKKDYPITNISWFDALNFGNQYNQWLFTHFKDKIPKANKSYGFLRLPTEEEWEFAARGASTVSIDVFNQKTPYPPEKLHEYEWFGGPISSHYKLQPTGKLKPNPIGLHDMLGNADEITMSLFKVKYNQGRTGGFVIKGNNYISAKNRLRSSFRSEQPFYRLDSKGILKPHTKKTLGFRLVISAVVFSSHEVHQKMSSEWSTHQENTNTDISVDETSLKKTILKGEDMLPYLERLVGRLGKDRHIDSKTGSILGHPNRTIRDIITVKGSKKMHASYLWIKVANEQANYIRKETQRLLVSKIFIEISKAQKNRQKTQNYQNHQLKKIQNISNALSTYLYSIGQIAQKNPKMTQKGFVDYQLFVAKFNNNEQIQIHERVRRHFEKFQKNKKINLKKCKNEIIHLN